MYSKMMGNRLIVGLRLKSFGDVSTYPSYPHIYKLAFT